jgi:hypothetical protein
MQHVSSTTHQKKEEEKKKKKTQAHGPSQVNHRIYGKYIPAFGCLINTLERSILFYSIIYMYVYIYFENDQGKPIEQTPNEWMQMLIVEDFADDIKGWPTSDHLKR